MKRPLFSCLFVLVAVCLKLQAGIYLEKPEGFNPKFEVVGCCFLQYQDKIFLLHIQDFKPEGNRWGIPGGKLNKNEPLMRAIAREVFEETGFQLDESRMHHIGKVYIRVPNFDFEYHMVRYLDPIQNPGDVKINFREHKGYTWVTPEDAIRMGLITDEDTCFEIVFGLNRAR